MWHMINLLSAFQRDNHPIRLNREFHFDLSWRHEFFISWDGLSYLLSPTWASLPDFSVSSDAAGALGYGVISGHDWFVGKWSTAQQPLSIAYKELFPVVVAASLWGHRWATKRLEFCSDNMAVVSVLGGVVASWLACLTPDRAVRVRALVGDFVLCSWARHFTLTVPLSIQVYKWVPANLMLGVTLRWTSIPSRGE